MAENVERMTLVARLCAAYLAMAEPPPLPQPLSPREVQCLELLGQGHRNDRIAERLGLHRATVDMHIVRAPTKLRARTREQVIARAVSAGAICP
ncbi:helix-turn-helix transcriptional regulator [Rhodovulum sp. 12E13]|uniref:helix-turn-helix transcriptional regulator n=1 Tax=Rhodovulum sp. 12E13 TaxID=2203891 RepID=UPI001F41B449|nr:helix-turn-helix transcriptional regulator [Rhodovulum sp. 12E13]